MLTANPQTNQKGQNRKSISASDVDFILKRLHRPCWFLFPVNYLRHGTGSLPHIFPGGNHFCVCSARGLHRPYLTPNTFLYLHRRGKCCWTVSPHKHLHVLVFLHILDARGCRVKRNELVFAVSTVGRYRFSTVCSFFSFRRHLSRASWPLWLPRNWAEMIIFLTICYP